MPCFTPGIVTVTETGERAVEDLRPGDRVVTRDHGVQTVRWVGQRSLAFGQLQADPHLKPVLIRKGSLGRNVPDRDMLISPNTRALARSDRTTLRLDRTEALVAAKNLAAGRSIRGVDVLGVTYVHFIFDRHEIVLANGLWIEAFHPHDASLGAVGNAQRSEIFEIFPDLRGRRGVPRTAGLSRIRREAVLLDFGR